MFNFGLFTMHLPYVVLMMAYMLYFGANALNHPEEWMSNEQNDLYQFANQQTTQVQHTVFASSFSTTADTELTSTQLHNIPPGENLLTVRVTYPSPTWKLHRVSNIFSRPPPAKQLV